MRVWRFLSLFVATCVPAAMGQAVANVERTPITVGARFVATESNAPPGTCGCFWLSGAGVDAALPLWRGLALTVDLAGNTTKRVPSTTRGLSVITLLAGPRYAVPLRHHVTLQAQALVGVARGFDADFIVTSGMHTDTANVFGVALGGAVEVPVSSRLTVRAVQVEYLQTGLPNGVDDTQRNIRVGAGVVYRVRLPQRR